MPLPSLFLPHGAPDLPLTDHVAKSFLEGLSNKLPKPDAILVVSAHWECDAITMGTATSPVTVHDFFGWPRQLYDIQYPAKTSPALIDRVGEVLDNAGLTWRADQQRGYDHGVWIPLQLAYPQANIPIVQLSLVKNGSAEDHFALGLALAPLREQNFLIVGSGAATHNLKTLASEDTSPPNWATDFDWWLHDALSRRELAALLRFPNEPSGALMAHPTIEHFLPLCVALGAGWKGGAQALLHHSYSYSSISMATYAFGKKSSLPVSQPLAA